MSDIEPSKPYVYQPYGVQHPSNWECGRIYGIAGIPYADIRGLTKEEAEKVLRVLNSEIGVESRT